ncbi:MAG: ABC transporter ATP-binding protein, partial [Chloroflexi bacterium]|nr:ABC transporter ATP-binding protein [Chloroflexota bacterium]
MPAKDSPLGAFGLLKHIWPHLAAYRRQLALMLLAIAVEVVFLAGFPLSFKLLIDNAVVPHDGPYLLRLLVAISLAFAAFAVAGIGRKYLSSYVAAHLTNDLRLGMSERLQGFSMRYLSHVQSGEVLSRFSADLGVIEQALAVSLPLALLSSIEIVASGVLLCWLDWRLGLLTLALLPLTYIGPRLVSKNAATAIYRRKVQEASVLAQVSQDLVALPVIRALSLQAYALRRLRDGASELVETATLAGFLANLISRLADISTCFLQLVAVAFGAWLAFTGAISAGTLFGFVGLL